MPDIQTQIDDLLNKLKLNLEEITRLRSQAADLEKSLAEVQHDYEQKLGPLNAEADRLEGLKLSLRARLARQDVSPPKREHSETAATPPQEVIEPDSAGPKPPPPPPKDPRAARKRALADHVISFVSGEEMETVMQVVNAILDDERRDIGDMLELIPWGDIWTARAEVWETLDLQYERLREWDQGLTTRLTYWQGQIQRLEDDDRHGLLQEMQSRSRPDWLAYLDDLAQKQTKINEESSREVQFLEQQIAKHSESEGS